MVAVLNQLVIVLQSSHLLLHTHTHRVVPTFCSTVYTQSSAHPGLVYTRVLDCLHTWRELQFRLHVLLCACAVGHRY